MTWARVLVPQGGEQVLACGLPVDAGRVLVVEQVVERGVAGDPLHHEIEFPIVAVKEDRVAGGDGALAWSGHPNVDRLAAGLHLPIVPEREVQVMFAARVARPRGGGRWEGGLGVIRHEGLQSRLSAAWLVLGWVG
ncbi:hypothetical protein, partial [Actinacidiphila rubida]|uniref:hypothetical protein n=1 Tax=Actinacidiphila rubida TaxID=310780 RepID=UPI00114D3181